MSVRTSLLLSAAVAAMASSSAFAADLPSRSMAPAAPYIAAPPVFTWTGFYIGVNAGAAFGSKNGGVGAFGFTAPAPGTGFVGSNSNDTRFTGGGQIGYNWQVGALVYGLEADFNYLGNNGNNNAVVPAGATTPFFVASNRSNNDNFLGTVRGRLGYAVDRALFYVTGGLAYGSGSNNGGSVIYTPTVGGPFAYTSNSSNNSNLGYAVGGGLEYAFTPNWTAKVEYLYINRGNKSVAYLAPVGAPAGTSFVTRGHNTDNLLRVGINYKF